MLKTIFLLLLTGVFYSAPAIAQEVEEKSKGQNIVSPKDIQKQEPIKTKKVNSTIQNDDVLRKSNSNDLDNQKEYPKKISVGTKRVSQKEPIEKELTKEEKIEKLENEIITVEWKINTLKESEEANPEDINKREEYLVQLRNKLEKLTQ